MKMRRIMTMTGRGRTSKIGHAMRVVVVMMGMMMRVVVAMMMMMIVPTTATTGISSAAGRGGGRFGRDAGGDFSFFD